MKDVPIIFSGPMVRALIEGRKTMTRRLAWQHPGKAGRRAKRRDDWPSGMWPSAWQNRIPGDRLWVRETWRASYDWGWYLESLGRVPRPSDITPGSAVEYLADNTNELNGDTRVAIHMPRWASRLTLVITETKIERLQDITEADAIAEGARRFDDIPTTHPYPQIAPRWSMAAPTSTDQCLGSARAAFGNLWNKLHGEDAWAQNPEVVALRFTVHQQNIDALAEAA